MMGWRSRYATKPALVTHLAEGDRIVKFSFSAVLFGGSPYRELPLVRDPIEGLLYQTIQR